MKVRIIKAAIGTGRAFKAGEMVELSEIEARNLVDRGLAVFVGVKPEDRRETRPDEKRGRETR